MGDRYYYQHSYLTYEEEQNLADGLNKEHELIHTNEINEKVTEILKEETDLVQNSKDTIDYEKSQSTFFSIIRSFIIFFVVYSLVILIGNIVRYYIT